MVALGAHYSDSPKFDPLIVKPLNFGWNVMRSARIRQLRRLKIYADGHMLRAGERSMWPQIEYVYICGEKDDAIRPEWEQYVAREYLHVEPVVIKGAGHANIVLKYAGEVADAQRRDYDGPARCDAVGRQRTLVGVCNGPAPVLENRILNRLGAGVWRKGPIFTFSGLSTCT
jgi:hypothetical protein